MNPNTVKTIIYVLLAWSAVGTSAFFLTNGIEKCKKLFQNNDYINDYLKIKFYSFVFGPIIWIMVPCWYALYLIKQKISRVRLISANKKQSEGGV